MKVLVVDDEMPARRRLSDLLANIPEVEVATEAASGREALTAIERDSPDLLLLDIQMPGLDGLALASKYAHLPPVIFVTAHDEHALAAFELNAVDYLLKPVRVERLAEAIRRARARVAPPLDPLGALPPSSPGESGRAPQVVTHSRGTIRWFDALGVTRYHAADKYTAFIAEGAEQLTEEPLAALEERLAPHGFHRVHRSELVRLSAIRSFRSEAGIHQICLEDGQEAQVSRRMVALLRKKLGL